MAEANNYRNEAGEPRSAGMRQSNSKPSSGGHQMHSMPQDDNFAHDQQVMQDNGGPSGSRKGTMQYTAINPSNGKYGTQTQSTQGSTMNPSTQGSTMNPSTQQQIPSEPSISSTQGSSTVNRQQQQQNAQNTRSTAQKGASAQPSAPRPANNMSPLDRLKMIQAQFKAQWVGINTDYSGRPGTSLLCNSDRVFNKPKQLQEEEVRVLKFLKVFDTLRNLESDYPLLISTGNDRQSRTQQNFFNKANKNLEQSVMNLAQYLYTAPVQTINQIQHINRITKQQLLNTPVPTQGPGRGYHIENQEMLYKLLKGDTKLVRSILEQNNFNYTDSHEWNILWSTSSCKSYLYEGLNEFQRINHFPQSYEITRKDRLCYNYVKMQERFGRQQFDFIPDTYILPQEFHDFHAHYQKLRQTEPKRNIWIVKPANSSRGRGIHIIENLDELNVDETSVISRYITNPLLINGHKFDLRIYVVITCYEPLRIYVYKEGLARFASESYSTKFNKNNRYMHLTNYSINKKNEKFVQNEDAEQDDVGFKWSLTAFCNHLEQVGIDMDLMWSRIYDVILKTIACGDNYVIQAMKKNWMYRQNCFEIFGFDILLDSDLKPWIIEVNLSPSLSADSPLDMTIKQNLLVDTWNMCGVRKFDRRKESLNKLKYRNKNTSFQQTGTATGKAKAYMTNHSFAGSIPIPQTGANDVFIPGFQPNPQVEFLIDKMVEQYEGEYNDVTELLKSCMQLRYRDLIAESVHEFSRMQNFCRIYPSRNSKLYDKFLSGHKSLNKVMYKVFYTSEILPYERMAGDKSAHPISSKAQALLNTQPMNGDSQNRLHSSTGARPIRGSKSNQKLQLQQQSSLDHQNSSSQQNATGMQQNRTNSQSPTEKRDRFRDQQHRTLPKQRNGSLPANHFTGLGQNQAPGSTRQIVHQTQGNKTFQQSAMPHSTKAQSTTVKRDQPDQSVKSGGQSGKPSKVMITGDDILIEYVSRLSKTLTQIAEDHIDTNQRQRMEKFISHYVWHMPDQKPNGQEADSVSNHMQRRLTNRLSEMTDRRRRLIKYMYKKEGRLDQFDESYPDTIRRKDEVIHRFSSYQLEELLNNSTKNVAQEVVTCLIPKKGEGVLVLIETQHQSARGSSQVQMQQQDVSQLAPQPKASNNLPQPVPFKDGGAAQNQARRSPIKERLNASGEHDKPQFVAPEQYQQQQQPGSTHDY